MKRFFIPVVFLLSFFSCKKDGEPRIVDFTIYSAEPIDSYEVRKTDGGYNADVIISNLGPRYELTNDAHRKFSVQGSFKSAKETVTLIRIYREDGFTLMPSIEIQGKQTTFGKGKSPNEDVEGYRFLLYQVK